jgi:hypothetical protein
VEKGEIMRVILIGLLLVLAGVGQAQTSLPAASELGPGWNTVATDGLCSAGTPFQFYVKPAANPAPLLIFFNGGGACWTGPACDLSSQPNTHSPFADMDQNNPALGRGIFDFSNTENPFADYAMVVIPYCTGDVHIGSGTRNYTYSNAAGTDVDVTVHHDGYVNSQNVLDWVYRNFQSPTRVTVSGSSAGAIGASFYAGMIAEHYAPGRVVLLADAAGAYGTPNLPVVHRAWNTAAILPDWPEYARATNDSLTFEDFYIASANHSPNLTIAQYNAALDSVQNTFTQLIGDPAGSYSLPLRLLNNYQRIESGVETFYSYTAGGTVHTIMASPIFYTYSVEGVRFVDWVSALISGEAVRDISCVRERKGCDEAP